MTKDWPVRALILRGVMEPIRSLDALFPDRSSTEPLGRQLTRKMRQAIESGELRAASRLLPSREMALRLGLARNTVVAAIEQLVAEGYLESRVGAGTFVAPKRKGRQKTSVPPTPASARRLREFATAPVFAATLPAPLPTPNDALRSGIPDVRAFPINAWNRLSRRHLHHLPDYLSYGDPKGYRALREAISQHLRQFRRVASERRNVIIVEGTQAALALVARVLVNAGDRILLEDPCYGAVRRMFAAHGSLLVPLPVDEDGLDADAAPPARLAFVAPSHQYPLGGAMSLTRREALLRWAARHDAYVLEDDYDSEFSYAARPLPALQSLDRAERVIYIGTFSKTLAPGLRVGYLIVPEHLRECFAIARSLESHGCATLDQAILAEFVAQGHFARHVRRMTGLYARRRERLLQRVTGSLPHGFTLGPSKTGLHVALRAPSGFDDASVVAQAAREGLHLEPLSTLCVARQDCSGFVLGYASRDIDDLTAATEHALRLIASASL